MSGGEPLWRRVAGLYLSGVPLGDREPMSTRLDAPAARNPNGGTDPKQEVVLLGEALDLVTLAQGYGSPAVPLLLRALIRGVREMGAAPDFQGVHGVQGPAQPANSAAPEAPAKEETPPAPPQPEPEKAAAETPAEPAGPTAETPGGEAPEPARETERFGALEKQVKDADRKVSALTTAVGQLVEVLQRRTRDGGGVDRRAFPRVPGGNAKLNVRGNAYQVVNWSRGGFLIRIGESDRFSRGGFDYHFVLELPDETIQFQGRAVPVRIERTLLAAEFAGLDEATATKVAEVASRLASAPV
jgi:hypothetical protein